MTNTVRDGDMVHAQRMAALANGNRVRNGAGVAKLLVANARDRAQSYEFLVGLLANPPAAVRRMRVIALLKACRGIGPSRVRLIERCTGIDPSITVGELDSERRARLIVALVPSRVGQPPARPLVATGIVDALIQTGMPVGAVAYWFTRRREELEGASPRELLATGHPDAPGRVLDLARNDAAELRNLGAADSERSARIQPRAMLATA